MKGDTQIKIRLPADVKRWIAQQAQRNSASQNSEVVRSIRERMDRMAIGDCTAKPRLANSEQFTSN